MGMMIDNPLEARIGLNGAVERQQMTIAMDLFLTDVQATAARADRLDAYIRLLGGGTDTPTLGSLATEFFRPRNLDEAYRIMDAGGDVYGL